jgi:hypothetical protein
MTKPGASAQSPTWDGDQTQTPTFMGAQQVWNVFDQAAGIDFP